MNNAFDFMIGGILFAIIVIIFGGGGYLVHSAMTLRHSREIACIERGGTYTSDICLFNMKPE